MERWLRHLLRLPLATALREALHHGYDRFALRADLLAGVTVGIVAVPLAMALGIAAGVPPQHGLYTAIFAGLIAALLGGSRYAVSGPTAAFVVILQPIAVKYGVGGLLTAGLMAGLFLVLMGAVRMGTLLQYIPHPVTTGFTAGIAVVIATLQFKDLLGLDMGPQPSEFGARLVELAHALPSPHTADLAVGLVTLSVIVLWPRLRTAVPAPLVGILVGTGIALAWTALAPATAPITIHDRFAAIPAGLPDLTLPWAWPGPDGQPHQLDLQMVRDLLGPAFAIALLAAIESLLCAVVADGLTGTRHHPDGELIGIGAANLVVPFLGGIAATGALARTAANVRAGARSPLAAMFHALFVLAVLLALAPLLERVPMAALAALLLTVAWHMSESERALRIVRIGPKSDTAVLFVCFALTVFVDMVFAVGVGVVLAALLFMRRMANFTDVRALDGRHPRLARELPPGVVLYHINGPLFFGAADRAAAAIEHTEQTIKAVVLDLSDVPVMDVTGVVALEAAVARLQRRGLLVVLAGVTGQPRQVLERAGLKGSRDGLRITRDLVRGVQIAERHAARA
jgi:SulP family sulfate permease